MQGLRRDDAKRREIEPLRIFRQDVEQDAGIDESAGHLPSHEGHDLIGREPARRPPPHMLYDPATARTRARLRGFRHPNGVIVDGELDLRIGQQAKLLTDLNGDGDLTFTGDAHGKTPTSKSSFFVRARASFHLSVLHRSRRRPRRRSFWR